MTKAMRALGATGLLLALTPAQAQTFPLLDAALQQFQPQRAQRWSYERAASGGREHTVERFDAARPTGERWSLLQIDGQQPDDERLARYAATSEARSEREHPAAFDPLALIDLDSVELEQETAETLRFRFRPRAEDDATAEEAQIVAQLTGTLVVNRSPTRLATLELTNPDEFSPARLVRIRTLRTRFEFAPLQPGGPTALSAVETQVDGRFMKFKKIQQQERVEFRDFKARADDTD